MSDTLQGIIYPPPELRGIVDSTARYVAKNGAAFEERIKREHKDKPKFSFLLPGDPFNAYYHHKVKEIRNSLLEELEKKQIVPQGTEQKASDHSEERESDHAKVQQQDSISNQDSNDDNRKVDETVNDQNKPEDDGSDHDFRQPKVSSRLAEYIQEKTVRLVEPPPLNYLFSNITPQTDLETDIIKLTAQFVAVYGRSFLLELVSREQNNCEFDFVKPQHGHFSYMTNLIMQYALIRNQPLDILEQLNQDANNQRHVLDKIRVRAEWNKMLAAEKLKRQEAEEREKILYSQIDWHDFVVAKEIDYEPDERGEFPPTTADQVGTRMLQQQRFEEKIIPEAMDIDMEMESDQEDADQLGENFAIPEVQPPVPDKVIIKKDYDPKNAPKPSIQADNYFVSPITNERIPVDKIHEHVRYNLADPKYLEKKDQMLQERMNEEAVFASGSQIQNSLKNLAERRTDIFGRNEEAAIGRRIGEEDEPQNQDRLIWDGHKSSIKKKKTS